jgi:hypothetical protein
MQQEVRRSARGSLVTGIVLSRLSIDSRFRVGARQAAAMPDDDAQVLTTFGHVIEQHDVHSVVCDLLGLAAKGSELTD